MRKSETSGVPPWPRMTWLTVLIAGAAAWLLLSPYPAKAAERVALVIGTGPYRYTTPLENPPTTPPTSARRFATWASRSWRETDLDRRAMGKQDLRVRRSSRRRL